MAKGGQYERVTCRQLSLWYSQGTSDDLFWRSSTSGGRATTRHKKGKTTRGHYGDIAATDSIGEPLIKLITFEVKCGYGRTAMLADIIDRKKWPTGLGRKSTLLGFFDQAFRSSKQAGTPYWAVIHKRNGREPVIYCNAELPAKLGCLISGGMTFGCTVEGHQRAIKVMLLDRFLERTNPKLVKPLLQRRSK